MYACIEGRGMGGKGEIIKKKEKKRERERERERERGEGKRGVGFFVCN